MPPSNKEKEIFSKMMIFFYMFLKVILSDFDFFFNSSNNFPHSNFIFPSNDLGAGSPHLCREQPNIITYDDTSFMSMKIDKCTTSCSSFEYLCTEFQYPSSELSYGYYSVVMKGPKVLEQTFIQFEIYEPGEQYGGGWYFLKDIGYQSGRIEIYDKNRNKCGETHRFDLGFDIREGYHEYGFSIEETGVVRFFVDGKKMNYVLTNCLMELQNLWLGVADSATVNGINDYWGDIDDVELPYVLSVKRLRYFQGVFDDPPPLPIEDNPPIDDDDDDDDDDDGDGEDGIFYQKWWFILLVSISSLIIFIVLFITIIFFCKCVITKLKQFDYKKIKFSAEKDKFDLVDDKENIKRLASFKIKKEFFNLNMEDVKVIKSIGSGGFAKVYHCKWNNLDVAFKCFKLFSDGTLDVDLFERELSLISSLRHENIPEFYGCLLKLPRIGYVTELCKNGNLQEYLSNNQMDLINRFRILAEIANGIYFLHSKNVLHRDLKPENVLLDKSLTAKIIDFGLSKIVDRQSQTQTQRIGTSMFMSPEMALGKKYDKKTDVFRYFTNLSNKRKSYGIVIYTVITNCFQPFGKRSFNVHMKMANDENFRPPLKKIPKNIVEENKWIINLMRDCWRNDSYQRPGFVQIFQTIEKNFSL